MTLNIKNVNISNVKFLKFREKLLFGVLYFTQEQSH